MFARRGLPSPMRRVIETALNGLAALVFVALLGLLIGAGLVLFGWLRERGKRG
jgi:hypothetical protein